MNNTALLPAGHQKALLEGLAALCRIFWGPDTESCEAMCQGDFFQPFQELSPVVTYTPPDILDQVKSVIKCFPGHASLCRNLEGTYVRLFINTRGGIPAPLYQSCYESDNGSLMGPPAMEMKNRFQSKGLALDENLQEPPDHISVEIEYLYFLLDRGWTGPDRAFLAEAASFSADVMIPWIVRFQKKLAGEVNCRFYTLTVSLLISILDFVATAGNSGLTEDRERHLP